MGRVHVFQGEKEGLRSVRLQILMDFSGLGTVFRAEARRQKEFVSLRNAYSLVCNECMGGGVDCMLNMRMEEKRANKFMKG